LGPAFFDRVDVQRTPPGVRCTSEGKSILARPDANDWLVLLG
jgi:hypothetical protein